MTDAVNPVVGRRTDPLQTTAAIRFGGVRGFIVPAGAGESEGGFGATETMAAADLNAFTHSATSGRVVTIDGGEGYAYGGWFARDVPTDVDLGVDDGTVTVGAGWVYNTPNTVRIAPTSAFNEFDGWLPIYEFTVSGGSVVSTDTIDHRPVGMGAADGLCVYGRQEAESAFTAQADHDTLQSDHDTLRTDHDALRTDHDGLQTDHNTLRSDHDTLRSDHDTLRTDHDGLRTDHDTLRSDHDTLSTNHSALAADYDDFRANGGDVGGTLTLTGSLDGMSATALTDLEGANLSVDSNGVLNAAEGITALSELSIDADKDWGNYSITGMGTLAVTEIHKRSTEDYVRFADDVLFGGSSVFVNNELRVGLSGLLTNLADSDLQGDVTVGGDLDVAGSLTGTDFVSSTDTSEIFVQSTEPTSWSSGDIWIEP